MKFRLIDEAKSCHSVSRLARALGVTRAGYHAWKRRPPSARAQQDERLKARITEIHKASHGIYGAPRVHAELHALDGLSVSRKRVTRLLRELEPQGRLEARQAPRTWLCGRDPGRARPRTPQVHRRQAG